MDSKKATVMSDGSIFIVPEQGCALQGRSREFFLDLFTVKQKWSLSASAYLRVSCKNDVEGRDFLRTLIVGISCS